jgi:hypothetical protein
LNRPVSLKAILYQERPTVREPDADAATVADWQFV